MVKNISQLSIRDIQRYKLKKFLIVRRLISLEKELKIIRLSGQHTEIKINIINEIKILNHAISKITNEYGIKDYTVKGRDF